MTVVCQPKARYAVSPYEETDDEAQFYACLEANYELAEYVFENNNNTNSNMMENIYMHYSSDDIIVPPRECNPVKAAISAPTSLMTSFDNGLGSVDMLDFDEDFMDLEDDYFEDECDMDMEFNLNKFDMNNMNVNFNFNHFDNYNDKFGMKEENMNNYNPFNSNWSFGNMNGW